MIIMAMETITIEIDTDLYNQVKEIFSRYGLTVEEAIVLFIKETVKRGTIPFSYSKDDLMDT